MDELKPCPFCGSNKVSFTPNDEQPYFDEDGDEYGKVIGFIWCHGCNFSSDLYLEKEAYNHWNRRDPDMVEVVRCKDCKWHDNVDGPMRQCDITDDDDFCSYGEREAADEI